MFSPLAPLATQTLGIVGALLLVVPAMPGAPAFRLENKHLQVGFSQSDGRLVQFTDRNTHWNHTANQAVPIGLWKLELLRDGKKTELTPATARQFRYELSRERYSVRLSWTSFGFQVSPQLEVIVESRLDPERAMSSWHITVANLHGTVLDKVHFPQFPAIRPQVDECLAVPVWMGQLATNPRSLFAGNGKRLEWEYPGLTALQCLAFYRRNGPGLYFSCDDTASFRKCFALWGSDGGQLNYELVHLPENREADTYSLPYHAIIGCFEGDWFTAAEQYRFWATNQVWAQESRLASGRTPKWAVDTGMWVWNRGRSGGVLDPALALQKQLGLPVSVFWHWWHGCAYDTGFPEYLPPREGVESFTNALARAHQQDVRAIVYMNQRLWGMKTESWKQERAESYAVKASDGTVHPEVYNTFSKLPCASMCMGTQFWRDKYASLAELALQELGVDGIYMDQACSSLACYDPNHGHPLGGGRYWMEGFRLLASEIRSRSAESNQVVLAGEGCGEGWLPYLDLMLSLQVSRERSAATNDCWLPIPFFQAVYHPYCILYGNYSSLTLPPYDELWPTNFAPAEPLRLLDRKYSRQFLLEQARAWVWGQQPTVANFLSSQIQERSEETDYMMQLAGLRRRSLKYLQSGVLLRPLELKVPDALMPMSRLSIYAGQQGAVKSFKRRYPLALGAAWRAPDRDVGVALASIASQPLTVRLVLDGRDYGLPGQGRVYRIGSSGRWEIDRFAGRRVCLKVPLAAREACVLEFSR